MLNLLCSFAKRKFQSAIRALFQALQSFLQFIFTREPISPSPPLPDPPFDPEKPALPVSFPICKLKDLESRSYFKSFHFPFNIASVPLAQPCGSLPLRPRLLVCHDMAGGYVDDKWVQGGTNSDAYAIWHWYLIDIFVYFSHNLVTLPPPCWINTAHTHGVKVLGTFITEWDEGRVICNTLLSTKESARMYAERLAELACALGFDGWLINMEIQLDLEQIPNLKEFVDHLTQIMHSSVSGSLVIWYDSVTKDGDLCWQNQLNENNKSFFDLCDGIFVNYSWKVDYPKLSAAAASNRKFDVYMGIDVFGRNTYGGGQWNTNVALDVLKKDAVSAAIFAPGWVYETKQGPDFQTAQNRWWGLVEKSWGIQQNYPKTLPFYSNFDKGYGYHISVEGQQVSNDLWCNISCQSFQPVLEDAADAINNLIHVFHNIQDPAYSGGGNITFKGSLDDGASFSTRLFQGKLPLSEHPIYILYSVKTEGRSLLALALQFSSNLNGRTSILLAPNITSVPFKAITGDKFCFPDLPLNEFDKVVQLHVRNLEKEDQGVTDWLLHECSIKMDCCMLTDIYAVCYKSRECGNNVLEEKPDPKLESWSSVVATGTADYCSSLGHISIRTTEQSLYFPPSTAWVVEAKNISWASEGNSTLSAKIVWKLKEGSEFLFTKYNIYIERLPGGAGEDLGNEYLGVAMVKAFYVSELPVPLGISKLKFIIQVCMIDGSCQKLDSCPSLLLGVVHH